MQVDRLDRPAWERVYDDLLTLVERGQIGDRLPAKSELARAHGVVPNTVTKAIDRLKQEGLVTGQQGRGLFITGRPGDPSLPVAQGFATQEARDRFIHEMSSHLEQLLSEVASLRKRVDVLDGRPKRRRSSAKGAER